MDPIALSNYRKLSLHSPLKLLLSDGWFRAILLLLDLLEDVPFLMQSLLFGDFLDRRFGRLSSVSSGWGVFYRLKHMNTFVSLTG